MEDTGSPSLAVDAHFLLLHKLMFRSNRELGSVVLVAEEEEPSQRILFYHQREMTH